MPQTLDLASAAPVLAPQPRIISADKFGLADPEMPPAMAGMVDTGRAGMAELKAAKQLRDIQQVAQERDDAITRAQIQRDVKDYGSIEKVAEAKAAMAEWVNEMVPGGVMDSFAGADVPGLRKARTGKDDPTAKLRLSPTADGGRYVLSFTHAEGESPLTMDPDDENTQQLYVDWRNLPMVLQQVYGINSALEGIDDPETKAEMSRRVAESQGGFGFTESGEVVPRGTAERMWSAGSMRNAELAAIDSVKGMISDFEFQSLRGSAKRAVNALADGIDAVFPSGIQMGHPDETSAPVDPKTAPADEVGPPIDAKPQAPEMVPPADAATTAPKRSAVIADSSRLADVPTREITDVERDQLRADLTESLGVEAAMPSVPRAKRAELMARYVEAGGDLKTAMNVLDTGDPRYSTQDLTNYGLSTRKAQQEFVKLDAEIRKLGIELAYADSSVQSEINYRNANSAYLAASAAEKQHKAKGGLTPEQRLAHEKRLAKLTSDLHTQLRKTAKEVSIKVHGKNDDNGYHAEQFMAQYATYVQNRYGGDSARATADFSSALGVPVAFDAMETYMRYPQSGFGLAMATSMRGVKASSPELDAEVELTQRLSSRAALGSTENVLKVYGVLGPGVASLSRDQLQEKLLPIVGVVQHQIGIDNLSRMSDTQLRQVLAAAQVN